MRLLFRVERLVRELDNFNQSRIGFRLLDQLDNEFRFCGQHDLFPLQVGVKKSGRYHCSRDGFLCFTILGPRPERSPNVLSLALADKVRAHNFVFPARALQLNL